ncbi:MAG: hypothetical protein H7841_00380 [Magnetospirillum sp. WYHS-4]
MEEEAEDRLTGLEGEARGMADGAGRAKVDARVWLCDLTYTQQAISSDPMPNAIGGIATFTETLVELPEPIRIIKYPEKLSALLDEGPPPQAIGFSSYIWNFELGYRFAQAIKRHAPGTVVVFGGPNYPVSPTEQKEFLASHPAIDFYIVKEGEAAFAALIAALGRHGFDVAAVKALDLPSVHSIAADGTVRLPGPAERIKDLTVIPSPYLTGRLDEFFDGRLMPIIQTNRGCPFTCTFCVEGTQYYNKIYRNAAAKTAAEVAYIAERMVPLREKGARQDLFIADSNFGMFKEDLETCRVIAESRQTRNWPQYISVATGKNQKERVLEAARLLEGALRLAGSVQSMDETVLKNIKRNNISFDQMIELALKSQETGAAAYTELILALPGETRESHFRSISQLIEAGFPKINCYTLMLLPGSNMDEPETRKTFAFNVKHRVFPRCFGHFKVFGEDVIAAEIERVVVTTSTMSFDDYVACRRMHLILYSLYSDAIFSGLVKLLQILEIPVFSWMEIAYAAEIPADLQGLFDSFERAIREELWDDPESLRRFVREPGVVERFIGGELGINVQFTHKGLAMSQYLDALAPFSRTTVLECIRRAGKATPEVEAAVDDIVRFHYMQIRGIFTELDAVYEGEFTFDVSGFAADPAPGTLEAYRLPFPVRLRFAMTSEQQWSMNSYLDTFGRGPLGYARIVAKFPIQKFYRRPLAVESVREMQ